MSKLIKPVGYKSPLDMRQTEQGIKLIKEFFQQNLSTELRLRRVTAPLFVLKGLGINDDLNGVERPVDSGVAFFENSRNIFCTNTNSGIFYNNCWVIAHF